jgi:hypothetical protein
MRGGTIATGNGRIKREMPEIMALLSRFVAT